MKIFGQHDEATIQQLKRCAAAERDAPAVLCADGHLGYSMPIGGVVAYRDHVSRQGSATTSRAATWPYGPLFARRI
jgi:tRNA-splicing ligase RtcB